MRISAPSSDTGFVHTPSDLPGKPNRRVRATQQFSGRMLGWLLFVLLFVPPADLRAQESRIAFISLRDGESQIYVINPDGSGLQQLARSVSSQNLPSWSPDGTRIAYRKNSDVYVVEIPAASEQALEILVADTFGDYAPHWSPDGRQILFDSQLKGYPHRELNLVNSDGSGLTYLSSQETLNHYPAWSPDGTKILFVASYPPEGRGLYSMNLDGNEITWLGEGARGAWSPDGTRIAFNQSSGYSQIWIMDADGSNRRHLGGTDSASFPAWSPDGTKIAFKVKLTDEPPVELWVMEADGTNKTRVGSDLLGYWTTPSWSPDGLGLVFYNATGIQTVKADGSKLTSLTSNYQQDYLPVWSPFIRAKEMPSQTSLKPLVVWRVGSPHRQNVPELELDASLQTLLHKQGFRARVRSFSATEFPSAFANLRTEGDPNELPDVIAGNNHLPFSQLLREVPAGSLIASHGVLQAIGSFVYLPAKSTNHEIAVSISLSLTPGTSASRQPVGDLAGRLELEPDFQILQDLSEKAVIRYLEADQEALMALGDPRMLPTATPLKAEPSTIQVQELVHQAALGNQRLCMILTTVSLTTAVNVGSVDIVSVWTKDAGAGWRLLAISNDPGTRGQLLRVWPGLAAQLSDGFPRKLGTANRVSPADGQYPVPLSGERFGDFIWRPSSSAGILFEIAEFHNGMASLLRTSTWKAAVSAGRLMRSRTDWTWRVWTIGARGEVVISEARTFQH